VPSMSSPWVLSFSWSRRLFPTRPNYALRVHWVCGPEGNIRLQTTYGAYCQREDRQRARAKVPGSGTMEGGQCDGPAFVRHKGSEAAKRRPIT